MSTSEAPSRSGLGLLLMVASAVSFGTSGAFAASLIAAGWSTGAAVTVRIGVAALLLTVPAVRVMRGRWSILLRSWPTLLLYGVMAVAGAQLFYFNAVAKLSVGVALLLEYLGTVLVVGWMWLRHSQRPRRLTVIGAAVAVVGLALVLDLTGSLHLDFGGVLWGLAAAVGLAVYYVIASTSDAELPPLVLAWAGLTIGGIGLGVAVLVGILPFRATFTDVQLAGTQVSWWIPVLGLSVLAAAFAYVAGVLGARMLGARVASFVGLTEVIAAVLFAWLLLGQVPAPIQLLGGALIIGGVALVKLDEYRTDDQPQSESPDDPEGPDSVAKAVARSAG